MDIIMIPIVMFAFLGGGAYLVYILMKKSAMLDEKRPVESQNESEIAKTLTNLAQKIPGFTPEDQELSREKGSWFTTADFPQTWEYILQNLRQYPNIFKDPKYGWRKINDNMPYKTITLNAGWDERQKMVSPVASMPDTITNIQITVVLYLKFEPLQAGGTAVHFEYHITQIPYETLMPNIVKETNRRLKQWCLNLSQDPNRGGIF